MQTDKQAECLNLPRALMTYSGTQICWTSLAGMEMNWDGEWNRCVSFLNLPVFGKSMAKGNIDIFNNTYN